MPETGLMVYPLPDMDDSSTAIRLEGYPVSGVSSEYS
jgi:hypothetical protein